MRVVVSSLLLTVTLGCGAPVPAPVIDAGTADAGADGRATQHLAIVSGTTIRIVDLATFATHALGAKTVAGIDQVVHAAFPEFEGSGFKLRILASDGFDPGSKGGCAPLVPVPESLLSRGGIDPLTRNLAWDDALGYPGCMYVHDCTTFTLNP